MTRNELEDGVTFATDDRDFQFDPTLGALVVTLVAARHARDRASVALCLRRLDREYGVRLADDFEPFTESEIEITEVDLLAAASEVLGEANHKRVLTEGK